MSSSSSDSSDCMNSKDRMDGTDCKDAKDDSDGRDGELCKVKICGLTRIDDIDAVNSILPDYIGFVFAQSRRQIDATTASKLKNRLDFRIKAVGVFVNESIDTVSSLYKGGIIDLVQLHGDEDDGYIARLKDACGCGVIKSVHVGDSLPPLPINADFLLFDTLTEQRGGSGKAFDWSLLRGFSDLPYFLAGGLTIDNVSEVLRTLAPYCVDISSGVETEGFKDASKIRRFVETVKTHSIGYP